MNTLPFRPLVVLPANLTVRFGPEALTTDDPRGWCQRRAAELLGERARDTAVTRLARSLEEHLEHFRKHMPLIVAAVCFYPDFATVPPRAMVEVQAFGDPEKGPPTMDWMRELYATPDKLSFGEIEVVESELPAGRALRVHRYRKSDPGKRRSTIMEEVVWLVWPTDWPFTIAMSTNWVQPAFAEAGSKIADLIANNFRIQPNDERPEHPTVRTVR